MAFSTPNIGFAGGAGGTIYKLEFQGATNFGPWEINLDLSPTNGPQIIPSIAFPTAAGGMFLTASPEADINSLIYHTADAGNTWDMTPDTIPGLLHTSVHAPDASTAWVVGYNGKIYKGVLSTVGIKESELTISTRVFPNPTTDIVKVELNGEAIGELNYTLLDVAGRQILSNTVEKQIVSQHFELDLGRLATGIYVLQISNLVGQNYSTRIVKQ